MTENQPNLDTICDFITNIIGPDIEAIKRFEGKETPKFEGIQSRLNELQALLEEVAKSDEFENPQELAAHLQTILSSVDALYNFVQDIKQRLLLLNQEVDRRTPKLLRGLFSSKESQKPVNLEQVKFETDSLMELYGISNKQEQPNEEQKNEEQKPAEEK